MFVELVIKLFESGKLATKSCRYQRQFDIKLTSNKFVYREY